MIYGAGFPDLKKLTEPYSQSKTEARLQGMASIN